MARLYLVRHAKPAAAWGEDPDPGLDALGLTQAQATARELADTLARLPIYTSPLRRCRETAAVLSGLWHCEAAILPSVAEIPSPALELKARHEWLVTAMRGTWRQLHDTAPAGSVDYTQWRRTLIDSLLAIPHDCVIHTHFIAINVAVGAAQSRDDVLCFRPDYASVTVLDTDAQQVRLVQLGREAETLVLARQQATAGDSLQC